MPLKENIRTNKFIHIFTLIGSNKIFWILSFTFLTAIAAQITVPVQPVPFTLQTMMVLLAGAVLGSKNGAYSQIIYLMLGVIGLPVFAQIPDPTIGLARLIGPTGGYLLAFPLAAYATGKIIEKHKSYIAVILAMFAGNMLILLTGSLYLGTFYLGNIKEAFISGAAVFMLWESVKVFAAGSIYFGLSKKYSKD